VSLVQHVAPITVHVLITVTVAALLSLTPKSWAEGAPARPLALAVRGSQLVNQDRRIVAPNGVMALGANHLCKEGKGIWQLPFFTQEAGIRVMQSWGVTLVRIGLAEECWIGGKFGETETKGARYRSAIARFAGRLKAHSMYAQLALFDVAGWDNKKESTNHAPMPTAAYGPRFWLMVARSFRHSPSVLFELYNEPHFPRGTPAWACWLRGCEMPVKTNAHWKGAGMQQLVNVIRAQGARNPIVLTPIQYATNFHSPVFLQVRDPLRQLIAGRHVWDRDMTPVGLAASFAPVRSRMPLQVTEIGLSGKYFNPAQPCDGSYVGPLLDWLVQNRIGFVAFSWETTASAPCPVQAPPSGRKRSKSAGLLRDEYGTPTELGATVRVQMLRARRSR
jgi:endoglucanase